MYFFLFIKRARAKNPTDYLQCVAAAFFVASICLCFVCVFFASLYNYLEERYLVCVSCVFARLLKTAHQSIRFDYAAQTHSNIITPAPHNLHTDVRFVCRAMLRSLCRLLIKTDELVALSITWTLTDRVYYMSKMTAIPRTLISLIRWKGKRAYKCHLGTFYMPFLLFIFGSFFSSPIVLFDFLLFLFFAYSVGFVCAVCLRLGICNS